MQIDNFTAKYEKMEEKKQKNKKNTHTVKMQWDLNKNYNTQECRGYTEP